MQKLIDDQINPLSILEEKEMKEEVFKIIRTLLPDEQFVIIQRFFHGETLQEIGMHINRTRQRISQIQLKAMRKLRHPHRLKCLIGYLCKSP